MHQHLTCILTASQVDESSPLAREWALWGMRNLCEGHAAIQQDLAQLKAESVIDTQELQAAGIKLKLDHATGKISLLDQ